MLDTTSTKYASDSRVTEISGRGYKVDAPGGPFHVLYSEAFAWTICHGPNLDYVRAGNGFAIGIPTADDAIDALLAPR